MSDTTIIPMMYRVDEAAESLRISRTAIYELIRSGTLRSVKVGRRRLVPLSELKSYVEAVLTDGDAA